MHVRDCVCICKIELVSQSVFACMCMCLQAFSGRGQMLVETESVGTGRPCQVNTHTYSVQSGIASLLKVPYTQIYTFN